MNYTVISLGDAELAAFADASRILKDLSSHSGPLVVVVSALKGTTEMLKSAASGAPCRSASSSTASQRRAAERVASILYEKHLALLAFLEPQPEALRAACARLDNLRDELARLLGGLRPSPDRHARILRFGSRFCAVCVAAALSRNDRGAALVESEKLGRALREADAAADMEASIPAVRAALRGHSAAVIPEYYVTGCARPAALVGRSGI